MLMDCEMTAHIFGTPCLMESMNPSWVISALRSSLVRCSCMKSCSHQQVLHPHGLLYHGGHHEEEQPSQHAAHHEEGAEYAHDAEPQVAAVLEKLYQREQQVGDEPRQEERQQHRTESVQQHDDTYQDGYGQTAAYKRVESDFLMFHFNVYDDLSPAKIQNICENEFSFRNIFWFFARLFVPLHAQTTSILLNKV